MPPNRFCEFMHAVHLQMRGNRWQCILSPCQLESGNNDVNEAFDLYRRKVRAASVA